MVELTVVDVLVFVVAGVAGAVVLEVVEDVVEVFVVVLEPDVVDVVLEVPQLSQVFTIVGVTGLLTAGGVGVALGAGVCEVGVVDVGGGIGVVWVVELVGFVPELYLELSLSPCLSCPPFANKVGVLTVKACPVCGNSITDTINSVRS